MTKIFLLCCYFFTVTFAAEDFHVLPLHFRTPEEVLPILQNMFVGRARFSQLDSRLVSACDDATYKEIVALLAKLDHKPNQLIISVKIARKEDMDSSRYSVSIAGNSAKQSAAASAQEQKSASQENGVRSVTVVEGAKANFRNSELLGPITGRLESEQGFSVSARIAQDHTAIVEIQSRDDRAARISLLSTAVHGELGKWFAIGSVNQSQQGLGNSNAQLFVWIKIKQEP